MRKEVGITCYIDNNPEIITEFGWLFKSWLYSGSWLTSDLVAFHHPEVPPFALPQERGVTYVPLAPHAEQYTEWREYRFINSIGFMSAPESAILAKYQYILKTDCDCFLTPHFPQLRPRLTTFGAGQYANEPTVVARLAEVAAKWGILPTFNNVGSTVFGRTEQVKMYEQLHLEYCKKLRDEEFQDGPGEWPGWWYGVLSMYAGQLAAQAYFGQAMNIGGLDCHCMAHEAIGPQDYHIHAWHTREHFSKFNWREGKYRGYDMSKLDVTRMADYCLWIAGEGPSA